MVHLDFQEEAAAVQVLLGLLLFRLVLDWVAQELFHLLLDLLFNMPVAVAAVHILVVADYLLVMHLVVEVVEVMGVFTPQEMVLQG